jgi:hypothetical protein
MNTRATITIPYQQEYLTTDKASSINSCLFFQKLIQQTDDDFIPSVQLFLLLFRLIIDVESFDYAYFRREAQGVRVALSHPLDRPLIEQTGFYVTTGKMLFFSKMHKHLLSESETKAI